MALDTVILFVYAEGGALAACAAEPLMCARQNRALCYAYDSLRDGA
jgi:hypothetical protein